MFDHIRSADRTVLFLNTLLLMDIAFLLAVILFNVIWGYVRRDHRLLGTTIDSVGPEPSAGASGSPWPGSPLEPCWVPCSPSSVWP
jgi:hypothetical protein